MHEIPNECKNDNAVCCLSGMCQTGVMFFKWVNYIVDYLFFSLQVDGHKVPVLIP